MRQTQTRLPQYFFSWLRPLSLIFILLLLSICFAISPTIIYADESSTIDVSKTSTDETYSNETVSLDLDNNQFTSVIEDVSTEACDTTEASEDISEVDEQETTEDSSEPEGQETTEDSSEPEGQETTEDSSKVPETSTTTNECTYTDELTHTESSQISNVVPPIHTDPQATWTSVSTKDQPDSASTNASTTITDTNTSSTQNTIVTDPAATTKKAQSTSLDDDGTDDASTEPSTAIGQLIARWDIAGITCDEPVAATSGSYPEVAISAKTSSGKLITGGKLSVKRIQNIKITRKCLRSYGADARSILEEIMSAINTCDTDDGTLYHVILPKGTYKLNSVLHIYDNTWLDLSAGTRLVRAFTYGPLLRGNKATVQAGGYSLLNNVCVQGGIFDANSDTYQKKATTTMRFGHARNILILNCIFVGCYSSHMLELGGVANVTVSGCTFKKSTGSRYKEAIQIEFINNSKGSPTYGYYDDTMSKNIAIVANTFSRVGRGIGHHSSLKGRYCTRILIENNVFTHTWNEAIRLPSFRFYLIRKNTITDCGAGIECLSCASSIWNAHKGSSTRIHVNAYGEILNNVIATIKRGLTSHFGISLGGMKVDGTTYKLGCMTIRGNSITSFGEGITLTWLRTSSIRSNTITSTKSCGINAAHVISTTLTSDTIKNAASQGIRTSLSTRLILTKLVIKKCSQNGVYAISKSRLTIRSSRIRSCKKWGIYASGKNTYIRLRKTTIKNCSRGKRYALLSATIAT